ncbi:MAG: magnesium transporter [Thermodesulfobacteriota bacterium]|nr:magnesium transporter [Thermodesulfobacteriota bacterium]
MSQTDQKIILDDIKIMLEEEDHDGLKRHIDELHPADLADLMEQLEDDEILGIINILTLEDAGNVLIEISSPIQENIVNKLDDNKVARILNDLNSDDATDIVSTLSRERSQRIIGLVHPEVSEELRKLLGYETDTAGGIMALEFVSVNADSTIGEAIEIIREKREEVENLYYVWVVDDFNKLVGVVSLKDLVLESQDKKIKHTMNPDVISADVDMDQEDVARIAKQYDLINVPVVDSRHRLIGRITNDDIIDVMEEEANEDISLMAGVIDYKISESSPLKISKARFPWLFLGLLGGLLSASIVSHFHTSIEKILALSFFIPVVMAMGGNTGTQAATVVIRGLATGDINVIRTGKRLLTELWVALINGIMCGVLLALVVTFWLSDAKLGIAVGASLIIVILFSGSFGAFIPFLLQKLNIDPALAAGPFITTANDIMGLFIYLSIITHFLVSP